MVVWSNTNYNDLTFNVLFCVSRVALTVLSVASAFTITTHASRARPQLAPLPHIQLVAPDPSATPTQSAAYRRPSLATGACGGCPAPLPKKTS